MTTTSSIASADYFEIEQSGVSKNIQYSTIYDSIIEEGTWTPEYTVGTGAFTSVTYDPLTYGVYSKIGNLVSIQGALRTDAITVGSASGSIRVAGLPYDAATTNAQSVNISYSAAFAGDMPTGGNLQPSTDYFILYYKATSNGASVALDVTDLGTGANNNYIFFSAQYFI